jgi:sec-independent protein translocase protein TatC
MPFISYFIWEYIRPGLTKNEQGFVSKYVLAVLLFSTIGVVFAYIFLIPTTLEYLLDFMPGNTTLLLTAQNYIDFMYGLLMLMVMVFQTPVVVYGLIKSGLVPRNTFIKRRREVYVAIIVFMAIFGGQDIITLILTSGPVILLYEGALFLSQFPKKQSS